MNTHQLRCFLAAADKLSFTKAANELFFSVPTVTHHIQNLESELQTELFVRGKKGVSLTESGKLFYPAAVDIMNRYESAVHSINSEIHFDVLKIGCTSYAEIVRMTPVFKAFRNKYPQILPHVDIENYDLILDKYEDQELDLVFATDNMLKNRKKRHTLHQLDISVGYAVVDSTDPLAERESISFEELDGISVIGLHNALIPSKTENKVTRMMHIHHLKNRDILVEDDRMALTMCKAGYGVAVLPSYCIPEYYHEIGLACIPIEESQQILYGVVYPRDNKKEYLDHFVKLTEIIYKKRVSRAKLSRGARSALPT